MRGKDAGWFFVTENQSPFLFKLNLLLVDLNSCYQPLD